MRRKEEMRKIEREREWHGRGLRVGGGAHKYKPPMYL